jgi:hypothetical protein
MSCGPLWLQRRLTEAPRKTSQRRETQGFKKEKSCPQTKFKSGPKGPLVASTTLITQRFGKYADAMVTEYNARYYQATKDGMCFTVATKRLPRRPLALPLTYTGLVLSNPITSQVDLVIVQASMMQSVIQATQVEAFALATGFNSHDQRHAYGCGHSALVPDRFGSHRNRPCGLFGHASDRAVLRHVHYQHRHGDRGQHRRSGGGHRGLNRPQAGWLCAVGDSCPSVGRRHVVRLQVFRDRRLRGWHVHPEQSKPGFG